MSRGTLLTHAPKKQEVEETFAQDLLAPTSPDFFDASKQPTLGLATPAVDQSPSSVEQLVESESGARGLVRPRVILACSLR